jgi:hypothetical protein
VCSPSCEACAETCLAALGISTDGAKLRVHRRLATAGFTPPRLTANMESPHVQSSYVQSFGLDRCGNGSGARYRRGSTTRGEKVRRARSRSISASRRLRNLIGPGGVKRRVASARQPIPGEFARDRARHTQRLEQTSRQLQKVASFGDLARWDPPADLFVDPPQSLVGQSCGAGAGPDEPPFGVKAMPNRDPRPPVSKSRPTARY